MNPEHYCSAPSQASPAAREFERLVAKGRTALAALGDAPDVGGRQEADAFTALLTVRELLAAVRAARLDDALTALQQLTFLPLERGRCVYDHCVLKSVLVPRALSHCSYLRDVRPQFAVTWFVGLQPC